MRDMARERDGKGRGNAGATRPRRGPGRPRANPRGAAGPADEQILRAAARLFASKGFANTTTREIAAAVGVRQPSLFHHFASKADILDGLLRRSLAPLGNLLSHLERAPQSAAAKLYHLLRVDVALTLSGPYELGGVVFLPELRAPRFRAVRAAYDRLFATYRELIAEGVRAGTFVSADLDMAARAVLGLDDMAMSWRHQRLAVDPASGAAFVAGFALRALLADASAIDDIRREADTIAVPGGIAEETITRSV